MELSVRFAHRKVDGLVSNLTTADGEAWGFGFGGEVGNIFLPTAALSTQGSFSARRGDARVTYDQRAGGAPAATLASRADFTGRLLGRGDVAGTEAVGTWALYQSSASDADALLAGAFGVQRGDDRPDPSRPLADDLTAAATAVTFSILKDYWAARDPARQLVGPLTTIASTDNKLVVQGWDRSRGSANPNYEALDERYVNFTLNRETLFDEGYPVQSEDEDALVAMHEVLSETHVSLAHKEITRLRSQLGSVIALDGPDASAEDRRFANGRRQSILTLIQTQIAEQILGGDAADLDLFQTSAELTGNAAWDSHVDYPVNISGLAQDTQLLADIDAVIAALQSQEALAAAFADRGIFHSKNDGTEREALQFSGSLYEAVPVEAIRNEEGVVTGLRELTQDLTLPIRHVWNNAPSRLLLWTDSTDFTRFGVWKAQLSRYATDNEVSWRGYNGFYRPGTARDEGEPFAYSPLTQVEFRSARDPAFPGGVQATYRGRMVASQNTIAMTGDVEARVRWDSAWGEASDGVRKVGTMRLTVDNIEPTDPNFGTLRHGLVDYRNLTDGRTNVARPGTFDVRSLEFDADVNVDSDGKASFTSAAGFQARVTHDTATGTYEEGASAVASESWYTSQSSSYRANALPGHADREAFDTYFTTGAGAGKMNVNPAGSLDAALEGSFVGATPDGPVGIIGTWSIIGDPSNVNIPGGHWLGVGNDRSAIHGAFGAEFAP